MLSDERAVGGTHWSGHPAPTVDPVLGTERGGGSPARPQQPPTLSVGAPTHRSVPWPRARRQRRPNPALEVPPPPRPLLLPHPLVVSPRVPSTWHGKRWKDPDPPAFHPRNVTHARGGSVWGACVSRRSMAPLSPSQTPSPAQRSIQSGDSPPATRPALPVRCWRFAPAASVGRSVGR